MHHNQAYGHAYKGGCGQWGRGKGNGPWGRGKMGNFWARFNQPPINIAETDSQFVISLFAAGLHKEKVTLAVKNDLLTISYPGAEGTEGPQFAYEEYHQGPFERQFQLNNKVLVDQISATYVDGILKVTLPKNPETNAPAQTIPVA